MVSWEGRFSWQAYAETGRPDFLNYLHAGDVTWEELWDYYRQRPSGPEAVRSLVRLFHLFHSSQYDSAGCWLDPDDEIYVRLRGWAEFALDSAERVSLRDVQQDLAGLVGTGLVTPLYYQAAYTVFAETSVDRHAQEWAGEERASRSGGRAELPSEEQRRLPVYHPGPTRFPHLQQDSAWNEALTAHLAAQYSAWNQAYVTNLPDLEEEEVWTTVGGEA
jgi:hypothetical protein